MSFVRADDSLRAAKLWLSYYDFQNMNYGSEELNQYAKTLPTSFFATAHLNSQLRPSYTNSTDVRFSFDYPNYVTYTIWYYAKGNSGYFKVKRGSKILPGWFRTEEDVAKHLKSLFTDRIVSKHLIPAVEASYERSKRVRKDAEELEKQRFESDPKNWTSEKRVRTYVELKEYLSTTTDQYSDDNSVYTAWSNRGRLFEDLKKVMSEEEIRLAESEV